MSALAQELGLSEEMVQRIIGDSLNVHLIAVFSYGLYVTLFVGTMQRIVARGGQRVYFTVAICLIWVFATVSFGMVWVDAYAIYVTYGATRDSMLGYIMGFGPEAGSWTGKRLAINYGMRITVALNAMLAELINIWRCWVLWDRKWFVVGLPLLGVISGLISHAFFLVALFPTGSMKTPKGDGTDWLIVYYSVTVVTNLLTTFLIIFRILSVGGLKTIRTYRGIIEVLVESAFLYSATYTILLALSVHDGYAAPYDSNWYLFALLNAVTAAAPTMIIGRTASMAGKVHPNDATSIPEVLTSTRSIVDGARSASIPPWMSDTGNLTTDISDDASELSASSKQDELSSKRVVTSSFAVDGDKGTYQLEERLL
ncbi:hypothetical protein BDZ89DRAFT_1145743 [Hymenopellis radicata]|nr:hypothetical protein BDZ89DRAFT_1145743 [Hymenopellis radicata]